MMEQSVADRFVAMLAETGNLSSVPIIAIKRSRFKCDAALPN
jgi:hypothetical protein